jgi:hypothetical protein
MRQVDLRQHRLAGPERERSQRQQHDAEQEPEHQGQSTRRSSAWKPYGCTQVCVPHSANSEQTSIETGQTGTLKAFV